jgi:hypothetical protein
MLDQLEQLLKPYIRTDVWRDDVERWGRRVDLYRRYMDGDHRANLTREMKALLRISGDELDQFNNNYCELIVATMADRLSVQAVIPQPGDEAAQAWADELLRLSRLDALQMEVHESAVLDGDTFVMVDYDVENERVRFTHEPAWDGETGVILVYDRMGRKIEVAIKAWYEAGYDNVRVNLYYPDRIEKYRGSASGGGLMPVSDEPPEVWLPGVVPFVHFKNRSRKSLKVGNREHGVSEIDNIIPLQDALNRTLVSMVMVSELSAFQIKVAKGFSPPKQLTPGMWVEITRKSADGKQSLPLQKDDVVDAFVLEQAQLVPFIQQAEDLRRQIGEVSRTPLASTAGSDSSSGEALKQREIGLLSKIKKAQTVFGNAWEDAMALAVLVQNAYGTTAAPTVESWSARWVDAQIRNATEQINNALLVRDIVGEDEVLNLIAPIFDYTDDKLQQLSEARESASRQRTIELTRGLPNFNEGMANLMGE